MQAGSELGPCHGTMTPSFLPSSTSQLWMRGERTHGPRGAGGQVLRGMCRVPRRLAPLHQLLQPLASLTRVVQCAEAVPTLLQAFFSAVTQVSPLLGSFSPTPRGLAVDLCRACVLDRRARCRSARGTGKGPEYISLSSPQFADGALSNQLALLLLERSDSLYQVPQYEAHVHRWVHHRLPDPPAPTPASRSACCSFESPRPLGYTPFQLSVAHLLSSSITPGPSCCSCSLFPVQMGPVCIPPAPAL